MKLLIRKLNLSYFSIQKIYYFYILHSIVIWPLPAEIQILLNLNLKIRYGSGQAYHQIEILSELDKIFFFQIKVQLVDPIYQYYFIYCLSRNVVLRHQNMRHLNRTHKKKIENKNKINLYSNNL